MDSVTLAEPDHRLRDFSVALRGADGGLVVPVDDGRGCLMVDLP